LIQVRRSNERGHANHGWLDSQFSFSFADYYDPEHMGFRDLRVINEDHIAPGQGFGTHPHRDMEILTWILDGELEHRDSMGSGAVIRPGELQHMTAGTGITHSEFNPSKTKPVHLLQIWILPEKRGLKPGYEQKEFPAAELTGGFRLLAAHDGRDGALQIRQDSELYVARLENGGKASHELKPGRHAWVQVARGAVKLNGKALEGGDGAAISGEEHLDFTATADSEILLFNLA
jgi:redox-sensitive bicupin YhaK (pirin superfamily)